MGQVRKVRKLSENDLRVLRGMDMPLVEKSCSKMKVVRWLRPGTGRFKINLDGSSLGNLGLSGGGGVLRDHGGSLVAAFLTYFGQCSSIEAELRAALEGLKLCISLGFVHIDIECDSLVLLDFGCKVYNVVSLEFLGSVVEVIGNL